MVDGASGFGDVRELKRSLASGIAKAARLPYDCRSR
jgi:hypothetical protein